MTLAAKGEYEGAFEALNFERISKAFEEQDTARNEADDETQAW